MKALTSFLKILIICIPLSFMSCIHYYYAPNAHNVPMLKENGDTKIIAAASFGDEFIVSKYRQQEQ